MPRLRALGLALLAGAVLTTVVPLVPAAADSRPVRAALDLDPRTGRVLVRYRDGVTAATRAAAARTARARVQRHVPSFDVDVLVPDSVDRALSVLRSRADVVWAQPEVKVQRHAEDGNAGAHSEIGMPNVSPANTGLGVKVAVIDDGVFRGVPDLPDARLVDGGDCSSDVCESTGALNEPNAAGTGSHGTAVAALIGAAADGNGIVGVAPGALIYAYRVFGDPELGTTDLSIANAIIAAAADQVDVANLSLGSGFDSPILRDAMAQARTLSPNTVWVASSGNDGSERPSFPAGDPYVLSVGATELASGVWKLAEFSNRGDVDVVAPGANIATWFKEEPGRPTALMSMDGTSFAAPLVAGIAALLRSGGVTGDRARAAILASSEPRNPVTLNPPAPLAAHGMGRADAALALGKAAPYTAVFVDQGSYVASQVGRRRLEILHVGSNAFDPDVLQASAGSFTNITGAAPSPGASGGTVGRKTAIYVAPTTSPGEFTITASRTGDPAPTVRPMVFTPNSTGPEGVPLGHNVTQSPNTPLRFAEQSGYIRTFPLSEGGCVDLDFSYPQSADASLLFVWAPATNGGKASAFDIPVGADDTNEFDGTYRFCGEGLPGGTYAAGFVLFDSSGNQPGGNDKYALRARYPVLTAAISAPTVSTNVSPNGTFPLSWNASESGTTFDIQYTYRQRNFFGVYGIGAWRTWRTNLGITNGTFGVSYPVSIPGATYFFRVRARDAAGKVGPWSVSNPLVRTVVPLDDRYHYVQYSAGWSKTTSSGRYMNTVAVATAGGQQITLPADTAGFTIIGDKCPTCGQIRVFVDGGLRAVVDTRASTTQARQQLYYTGAFSSIGRHTLRIETVGTSGRPRVVIDGIAIIR